MGSTARKQNATKTARTTIAVQGARVHNLKNISVEIPLERLAKKGAARKTASKKGAHAALASHSLARTPPVLFTRVVYVGPALGGFVPSWNTHVTPGSLSEPQP